MNIKKLTIQSLFSIIILSQTFCTLTPIYPFGTLQTFKFKTLSGPEYQQAFEKYMSTTQNNALWNTGFFLGAVGLLTALNYLNVYTENDNLEMEKYPYVQQWYQAMDAKYPQAHLHNKKIKKSSSSDSSSFYTIRFIETSLQEINSIYKKQIEDQTLTNQEKTTLQKHEFCLLSQAGYIENNFSLSANTAALAFSAATYNSITPLLKLYHPIGCDAFEITSFERSIHQFNFNYDAFYIMQILGVIVFSGCISMYCDNKSDKFAAAACDDASLEELIETCKNDKKCAQRVKILENELAQRKK